MEDLAQDTDEGRGKLRNVWGRRKQPLNPESPNETSHIAREGEEPRELKRLST